MKQSLISSLWLNGFGFWACVIYALDMVILNSAMHNGTTWIDFDANYANEANQKHLRNTFWFYLQTVLLYYRIRKIPTGKNIAFKSMRRVLELRRLSTQVIAKVGWLQFAKFAYVCNKSMQILQNTLNVTKTGTKYSIPEIGEFSITCLNSGVNIWTSTWMGYRWTHHRSNGKKKKHVRLEQRSRSLLPTVYCVGKEVRSHVNGLSLPMWPNTSCLLHCLRKYVVNLVK